MLGKKAVVFTSGTSLTEQPTNIGPLHHYCLNNDVMVSECKAALFGYTNILTSRKVQKCLSTYFYMQKFCYLQTSILGIFLLAHFVVCVRCFLVDLMLI